MRKRLFCAITALALLLSMTVSITAVSADDSELRYYLGSAVNAGRDTGYSKSQHIGKNDPHFGWELGKFFLSGYTRQTTQADGTPLFLKTVGDTVTLWFNLSQDITALNGDDTICIAADENGYDDYFGIEKTNFGRGTLIIRHTDHQNLTGAPTICTDYLAADLAPGSDTRVEIFEEGDYEVALNYTVKKTAVNLFGAIPVPEYQDYRIFFRFSVRNGNCMVYPFDVVTGAELTNSAVTENGFTLDLAKSRYLDIDIKKEVRREGADGLTEDVRFNKPARDGEVYTEEGIYTITVRNRYTHQTTTKVIYVGTDDVLKAYAATGLDLPEIENAIALGAQVEDDGSLIRPTEPTAGTVPPSDETPEEPLLPILGTAAAVIAGALCALWIIRRRRYRRFRF